MHVVPNVDDGATDLTMSLDMLSMAYKQGVKKVYCTSHNVYDKEKIQRYKSQFMMLQLMAKSKFPDLELCTGCELLCAGEYIDDILYDLEIGVFLPLGNSKCVLTELYPDVTPDEAKLVVSSMANAGWKPILAHVERYSALFYGDTIAELIELGAKIQFNLCSLDEDSDEDLRQRARYLVESQLAHFVGSDAHNSKYRVPKYDYGVQYLTQHCNEEYMKKLCYKNAEEYIA